MDGTNNLDVSLRNIVYTDSPIGVATIAVPQALLKEKEKNFESVGVMMEEVRRSSHQRIYRRRWRRASRTEHE
jgi:hypothetical protein